MKILKNHFVTHKFGGSSLANASRFKAVKQILRGKREIIVVSATKGTTSVLQNSFDLANDGKDYLPALHLLQQSHNKLVHEIISNKKVARSLEAAINTDFELIRKLLVTVSTIRSHVTNFIKFKNYRNIFII